MVFPLGLAFFSLLGVRRVILRTPISSPASRILDLALDEGPPGSNVSTCKSKNSFHEIQFTFEFQERHPPSARQ